MVRRFCTRQHAACSVFGWKPQEVAPDASRLRGPWPVKCIHRCISGVRGATLSTRRKILSRLLAKDGKRTVSCDMKNKMKLHSKTWKSTAACCRSRRNIPRSHISGHFCYHGDKAMLSHKRGNVTDAGISGGWGPAMERSKRGKKKGKSEVKSPLPSKEVRRRSGWGWQAC